MINQRNAELEGVETRIQLQANLMVERISGELSSLKSGLSLVREHASFLDLHKESDIQELITFTRTQVCPHNDLEGFFIVSADGSQLFSSYHANDRIENETRRQITEMHLTEENPFSLFSFFSNGSWHLLLSQSLFDKSGKLDAIVSLVTETESFLDLLSCEVVPGFKTAIIFNTLGETMAEKNAKASLNSDKYHTPRTIQDIPSFANSGILDLEETSINKSTKAMQYKGSYLILAKFDQFPFTLGCEVSEAQAMFSYDRTLSISMSILIIFIIIALVVIIILSRQILEKEQFQQRMMEELSSKVKQRTAELELLSTKDSLTGLANRRKIDSLISEQVQIHGNTAGTYSILIIDIDYFKIVNDTFGHQTGDEVLLHTVKILTGILGEKNTLARWGGDEFLALLPSATKENALSIAEKLLQSVYATPFSPKVRNTLSIGIAENIPGESSSNLIKRADTALYLAKTSGRNKAICG
ncbi:GGDEF domain-containing protein [uncultured Sphaerochaeta sp.]|uniref:GGDEF domain-containing protein n=1 Tax=uncultured Sphaerochaeta sp. TaxID=886478 RepID=UPI0037482ACE